MKKEEIEIIRSKGADMRYALERLEELSTDKYTRAEREAYRKQLRDQMTDKKIALQKGIEKGERKREEEMALKCLKKRKSRQNLRIYELDQRTG